jgi:hypothetical protein
MLLHCRSIFSALFREELVLSLNHDWCVGVDLHKDMLPASIRYDESGAITIARASIRYDESGAITIASMHFTLG